MDEEKRKRLRLARPDEMLLGVPLYCRDFSPGDIIFNVRLTFGQQVILINPNSGSIVGTYDYMYDDKQSVSLTKHQRYKIFIDPQEIVVDYDEDDSECI